MDKSLSVFYCDNGKRYLVPKKSCWLCVNADIFWDYTNGPYMILCSRCNDNIDSGLIGKCSSYSCVSQQAF
jgi:hypothetical protein